MADDSTWIDSNRWWTAAIVALVVLFIIFVVFITNSGTGEPDATLPSVRGQGLAWSQAELERAGFEDVQVHDAWGRDRGSWDDTEWAVCFQTPTPGGNRSTDDRINLAAAPTTDRCPTDAEGDQGSRRPVRDGDPMPELEERTAHMVREDFGERASIRFEQLDREDGDVEVTDDWGDWKVCRQRPQAGAEFFGQPLVIGVRPYHDVC